MSNIFNNDFLDYIQLLNKYNVEYVLIGGMAVNLHGYQRSTGDMDLFVNPILENHQKLTKVHIEYRMPMGEMELAANFLNTTTYDVFSFGGGFYKIELLTACRGLNFEETFQNAVTKKIEGIEVIYVSYPYLIKAKKASGRSKDLNDVLELEKINKRQQQNNFKLPITEKEISKWTNLPVYAPIYCASLNDLDIDSDKFVNFYTNCFKHMPWDFYDVKRKQWEVLPAKLKVDKEDIFKKYYLQDDAQVDNFIQHFELSQKTINELKNIQPWRRRSVCTFQLTLQQAINIKRIPTDNFEQSLDAADIRSLPRVFQETDTDLVEQELFYDFLRKIALYAQKVTPHVAIKQLKIAAHFMSVKARKAVPGNNSPEGAHEDGADFIVSALVINRKNISGAKSQVIEKMPNGDMVTLLDYALQPGEFLFQADTGEEKHYGNDLWHYVTPFYVKDEQTEACRDIVGLDISIVEPNLF